MKRAAVMFAALAVGCAAAGWRGRFDERMSAVLNQGTPIPAVAWYKLDGNALDSSGNGYDGTWTGTEAYTNGPFAGTQAGSFDGGSAILLPRPFAYQAITVCAWVERVGFGCFWGNRADFGTLAGHTVRIHTDGTLYVQVRSGGTWATAQSQSSVSTSWEFLCVSIDGRDIVGYADGVPVIDKTLVADVANATTANARIGSINSPPAVFFSGRVADVRIFDRALSADNIKRIMESQDNEPLEELQ